MSSKLSEKFINIFFIAFLILLLCAWLIHPTENVKVSYESSKTNYLQWNYDISNKNIPVSDSLLIVKANSSCTIYAILPDVIMPETCLGFYDAGFELEVSIDDKMIYATEKGLQRKFGHETSHIWRRFDILQEYAGKKITIKLINPHSEDLNINCNKIYLCYKNDIPYKILTTSFWSYIISSIYLILTIVFAAAALFLYQSQHKSPAKTMLSLAGISLCLNLWIFFYSSITQLFISSASVKFAISVIAFFMLPVALGCYFREVLPTGKKAFTIYISIYEFCVILAIIFNFIRIAHIMYFLYLVYIFFYILLILVARYEYLEIKKNKDLSHLGTAIVFILISIISGVGILKYVTSYQSTVPVYVGAASLLSFIAVIITEGQQNFRLYKQTQKIRNFREVARIESVTGGDSRIVAEEWLEEISKLGTEKNIWMIHMNLIDFSSVNAMMGWNNGDKILKDIYALNRKVLNGKDLECSMGSANYIFLLTNLENINEFCLATTEHLTNYLEKNWNGLLLSAKYAAIKVNKDDKLDQLLDSVQFAYTSSLAEYNKTSNCYYFTERCREQAKHNLELESNVQNALEKDEFKMYLQPKIDPKTDQVVGAEALVRWSNHKIGLIPPVEFIPVLEESGQVVDVDFFMFRKVCEYLVYRKEHNLPEIVISVNVSKYGITKTGFFETYKKLIEDMKVPANCLEFEFTESMAFTEMEAIETLIQEIHATGAKVSMDDFGSAYSNIGAIGRLKFDVVKLDKQFFDNGFPNNNQDYILVRGLINVFHDMKIKVVCEGIEQETQKRALKDLGADLIQGYFYSRPMLAEEFTKWMEDR